MIKTIPTEYNGTSYRTQLEARWAVFFDLCGIEFIYEQEGYEEDDETKYRPDFYLPGLEVHAEVKGRWLGYEKTVLKIPKFIEWGGPIKEVVILSDIPNPNDRGLPHYPAYYYTAEGIKAGWFFFFREVINGENIVKGHISSRKDVPPVFESDLKLKRFSIASKSDYKMQEHGIDEISWGMDLQYDDYIKQDNKIVFNALKAARSFTWNPPKVFQEGASV